MKQLIKYCLCVILCLGVSFSANAELSLDHDPKLKSTKTERLFNNKYVELNSDLDSRVEHLALVSYNENNQYFSLKTFKQVNYIQILNHHGELEYQLPINNSLIHLALSDFTPGLYTVNLLFEGEAEYLEMDLTIN